MTRARRALRMLDGRMSGTRRGEAGCGIVAAAGRASESAVAVTVVMWGGEGVREAYFEVK